MREVGFRRGLLALVVLLQLQFMLGMAVNLYVKIPPDHPGAHPAEYFGGVVQSVTWAVTSGPFWLILHASLGLLVVLAAFGTLVRAIQSRRRGLIAAMAVGAVAALAAGFNGGSYLNYNEDFSSMLMAAGFAISMLAYAIALYFA